MSPQSNQQIPRTPIDKYDVPAPRYTSYPSVPFWNEEKPDGSKWLAQVNKTFDETNHQAGISLYLHLPFCESLCTYCGCNKRITKNHQVEATYIEALVKEWHLYLQQFKDRPSIRELHLGGGTPTFFSPGNLKVLMNSILTPASLFPGFEFSFEGHPNNTTALHLHTLFEIGFRRVSFGVQDLDLKVQKAINRVQPFEKVQEVTLLARDMGYLSVNYDLIYGLPLQTKASIQLTMEKVGYLRPDRIAFYSYAHVPWKAPSQRGYQESDLPDNQTKRDLYEFGKEHLLGLGYIEIGMDHFALPHDPLAQALVSKALHRNFMGYTTCNTKLLIGLGMSAISDAGRAYMQNNKSVEVYEKMLQANQLPFLKGYFLSQTDYSIKNFILELICKGEAKLSNEIKNTLNGETWSRLADMKKEGLVEIINDIIRVTSAGKPFLRNICMIFDQKLNSRPISDSSLFSKAI